MNKRTSILLKKVAGVRQNAGQAEVTPKRMKRWWLALSVKERARQRKLLKAELEEAAT